jgi:hypothetical protein
LLPAIRLDGKLARGNLSVLATDLPDVVGPFCKILGHELASSYEEVSYRKGLQARSTGDEQRSNERVLPMREQVVSAFPHSGLLSSLDRMIRILISLEAMMLWYLMPRCFTLLARL